MLSIEILDYNGQFRLSYTFEREITRLAEEYAGMSLRWAVDSGLIHKDEATLLPNEDQEGGGGKR